MISVTLLEPSNPTEREVLWKSVNFSRAFAEPCRAHYAVYTAFTKRPYSTLPIQSSQILSQSKSLALTNSKQNTPPTTGHVLTMKRAIMNKKKKVKMTIDMPIISAITSTSRPILDDFVCYFWLLLLFVSIFAILSLSIRNEFSALFQSLPQRCCSRSLAGKFSRVSSCELHTHNLEMQSFPTLRQVGSYFLICSSIEILF